MPRTRNIHREVWKELYRQQRIIMREAEKVAIDAALFGVGVYLIGEDVPDFIRHVPAQEMF
jgi:hypothetical protein